MVRWPLWLPSEDLAEYWVSALIAWAGGDECGGTEANDATAEMSRRMRYRLDPLPVPDLIEAIEQSGDFGPPQCRQAANDVFR